jgi:oxygen-independent coproporphyrinogen III oxidase
MADFYERACEMLARAGYEHYEISNWAQPGRASKHNLKYWRREPYLGFGAGAHSFDGVKRWSNVDDPAAYAAAIDQRRTPVDQEETVDRDQALNEEFFLGLRRLGGIDLPRIEQQYGTKMSARVNRLIDEGLLQRVGDAIRLNPNRLTVSNEVFVELMD